MGCHVCGGLATQKWHSRWALTKFLELCDKHAEDYKDGLKKAEYERVTDGELG